MESIGGRGRGLPSARFEAWGGSGGAVRTAQGFGWDRGRHNTHWHIGTVAAPGFRVHALG